MLNLKNIKHFLAILSGTMLVSWLLYVFIVASIGAEFNYSWLYSGNYDASSDKIVIVKVDGKTLDALQSTDLRVLSFTKTKFSELLERLESHWAQAIGVDIVFANKSDDVQVLADTLAKYHNIVIGAKIGTDKEGRTLPLTAFSGATWGSVDTSYSADSNVLSRLPPFVSYGSGVVESLSMAVYRKYIGDETSTKGIVRGDRYFVTPLRSVPLDGNGKMLIRFFNAPEAYPSISMIDVLTATGAKQQELDAFFREKIVLVGEYGTLIHDDHFSPVDTRVKMPGVEFHANMLDGLLQWKTLVGQGSTSVWIFSALLAAILIVVFFTVGTGAAIATLIIMTAALVILGRRLMLGDEEGIVINLFFYLVVTGTAFIGTYVYKFLIVDRNKRYIEGAFGRYISPDVVKEISRNTQALELGGTNRRIAVFFSDIANFTTISESLGTEKIFTLLGEYLSAMTDILTANRGTLDKYIGDAVMGFFWAPHVVDRPAHLACLTALEQQRAIIELNRKWKERGFPGVHFRIGIHIWDAMVGNIGSRDRFNYTAIGDTVNLASRLEWVNKEYGTLICVSGDVYAEVKDDFTCRELDTIRVKGKYEGKRIYELLGKKESLMDADLEKYHRYAQGLAFYRAAKYEDALRVFTANAWDFTSEILAIRCRKILAGEMVVKNGVYEMKGK